MEYKTLSNGVIMPAVGFGTYNIRGESGIDCIRQAAECGYRLFDTASFYENEEIVGAGLAASGVPREELFVVTKLWFTELGYDAALQAFDRSISKLKTEYVDLYLVHWPGSNIYENWDSLDRDTWRALERLYDEKSVRAIGVSNFLPHHLMQLLPTANVMPMADEIEFHPGYTQLSTVQYCKERDIQIIAWSPIGNKRLLTDPTVVQMAEKYGVSAPKLCLRFDLQCNTIAIPKSAHAARMQENLSLFDFSISESDMQYLLAMPETGWSGEHPDRPRRDFD